MFFYKYIDIENYDLIQSEMKKFIFSKTSVIEDKLPWKFIDTFQLSKEIPVLCDFFKTRGLELDIAAAVYRRPYSQGGIHVDTSLFWRALLPVINCEGSKTKFFKFDPSKFKSGQGPDKDKNLSLIPGETLDFLGELELNKPIIFDPQIPHGVYCNPDLREPRISLTLGFKQDPKSIFKLVDLS
jgi:hypothetical protein